MAASASAIDSNRISIRDVLVLGLLSCIGPFSIDTYLPALPRIAQDFHAPVALVQLSLLTFFAAMAVGHLICGPLSDAIGRKKPLIAGLVLFLFASIGCALVQDIDTFLFMRFVQGLGASSGLTLVRSIVRDMHTGHQAVRLTALTMLISGLSPILAPSIGSALMIALSWRATFWFIVILVAAALLVSIFLLPETSPTSRSTGPRARAHRRPMIVLLRDGQFVCLALCVGFINAGGGAFLAGSPYIYQSVLHFSSTRYGLLFGINAIALVGCVQTNHYLMKRFGIRRFLISGLAIGTVLMSGALALSVLFGQREPILLAGFFAFYCYLGFVMTPAAILALHHHGDRAGSASALLGFLQFAIGAIATWSVSALFDGTARPLVATMAATTAIAFVFGGSALLMRQK